MAVIFQSGSVNRSYIPWMGCTKRSPCCGVHHCNDFMLPADVGSIESLSVRVTVQLAVKHDEHAVCLSTSYDDLPFIRVFVRLMRSKLARNYTRAMRCIVPCTVVGQCLTMMSNCCIEQDVDNLMRKRLRYSSNRQQGKHLLQVVKLHWRMRHGGIGGCLRRWMMFCAFSR